MVKFLLHEVESKSLRDLGDASVVVVMEGGDVIRR